MAWDDASTRQRERVSPPTPERSRTPLALIVVLSGFVVLTLLYNVSIPVWNAPDEPHHFAYVRFLLEHRELPNQSLPKKSTLSQGFKPPLYYFLGAVTLGLIPNHDTSDLVIASYQDIMLFRERSDGARNRFYPPLNPDYVKFERGRERNMFLRIGEDRIPFSGSALTVHLLRLPSVLMGALTIWLVFQLVSELFPNDRALPLLAAALCGFNPQFTFVHSYITNDGMVILLSTAVLWLTVRYSLGRGDETTTLVAAGCCIGLGLLTKTNAALLLPVSGIAILLRAWKQPNPIAKITRDSLRLGIPVLLVAGWYFVRGALIYGVNDPLGWEIARSNYPMLQLSPEHRWTFLTQVFPRRLFTSSWGQFDWLTIVLPTWAYRFYGLLSLLGAFGLTDHLLGMRRRRRLTRVDGQVGLLTLAMAIFLGNLFVFSMTFVAAQGRLIFPVIAVACLLMAMGTRAVAGRLGPHSPEGWYRLALSLTLVLAGMNVYVLVFVLRPAYSS